eukprot:8556438-Lingulodinium_polyedra.AAC.1
MNESRLGTARVGPAGPLRTHTMPMPVLSMAIAYARPRTTNATTGLVRARPQISRPEGTACVSEGRSGTRPSGTDANPAF